MTGVRNWQSGRKDRVAALVAAAVCVVLAGAALAVAALGTGAPSNADTASDAVPVPGAAVPADLLPTITMAARSCPALTPARLAGQLMAASGFDVAAPARASAAPGGGEGVAGLTAALWKKWAPSSNAKREDAKANIVALAHLMCDLVGHVRVAGVSVDLWRAALGAYHSGVDAVRNVRGVPDSAMGYVTTVAGYATWYQQQAQFGGAGAPSSVPTSTPSTPVPTTPVPTTRAAALSATGVPAPSPSSIRAVAPTPTPTAGSAALANSPTISFRVTTPGYTDRYLRHFESFAITSVIDATSPALDREDASFIVRPGLATSSCYSFESVNYPGRFLRDSYYRVRIDPNDGTALFAVDATFCARAGLSGHGISWESYGKPGYYLRHFYAELWMSRKGGPYATDNVAHYDDDTSWLLEPALAGAGP